MAEMTPVSADAPVMQAWNRYEASEEYQNTRKWALHEAHVDGSLWAAFIAGFDAEPANTLRARVAALEAENQLQKQMLEAWEAASKHAIGDLPSVIQRLEAENAQLRQQLAAAGADRTDHP